MLRVLRDGHLCLALASQKKGAHGVLSFLSKNYWSVWRSLGKSGSLRENVLDANVTRVIGNGGWNVCFCLPGISHYIYKQYYHRMGDMPAVLYDNGHKEWWKDGMRHRDNDKPAVMWTDGTKQWYKEGKLHRDGDKPATVWGDGSK